MPTYQELKAKGNALLKQAEVLRNKEVRAVIARIKAVMAEYEITLDDLKSPSKRVTRTRTRAVAKAEKAKSTTVSKPKYRNPETGATWTGHGKAPNWLKEAEAAGTARDDFLIRKAKRPS